MIISGTIPYSLLAYPRSGGNYTRDLLSSRLSLRSPLHHKISEVKVPSFIIAVVRRPFDCFASIIAQDSGDYPLDGISISDISARFISSMGEIDKAAKIIIDFDELESNPDLVVQKISSVLLIPIIGDGKSISIEDNLGIGYLATSKNTKKYDKAVSVLSQADLSAADEAYNRVISRAI